MRGLPVIALTLAALAAGPGMPAAAAAGAPRRLLAADHHVVTCYDTPNARIERWAIDFMCGEVAKGAAETWLLELADPDCVTKGKVSVALDARGEPMATTNEPGSEVCKTVKHHVAVDACALLASPRPGACAGYVDDRVKAAKSRIILTVHGVPEPKFAATVRFQIRLEAKCDSLEDPGFKGWFGSAAVLEGLACVGAAYVGETTRGTAPKDPWIPPFGPRPNGGGGGASPSPNASPPPNEDDGGDDHGGDDNGGGDDGPENEED